MFHKACLPVLILTIALFFTACGPSPAGQTPTPELPNPASVFCEEQGGVIEMRSDAEGGVKGVCVFPDGSECEEWAFYRDECQPASAAPATEMPPAEPTAIPAPMEPTPIAVDEVAADGCRVYRNAELGYSFHLPSDVTLQMPASSGANPEDGVSMIGPLVDGNNWPMMFFNHPQNRDDLRVPEGVDLAQWLDERGLLMTDLRQPDLQIAGATAIHARQERSPQSYAADRYFFAHDGQIYTIVLLHTADKEDWALYNHFLESIVFGEE